ncbi:GNAT family N-acetyltransferase [Ectobacillus funiculus]|uniref:GNAT family N-acetyltransferase n=1 Tax=Ectobacillus funiculus TaxID=137993 RepID=UPI00101BB849|nr:GNAT family N-acetyltransferase [Ectobacillus funiculus]
MNIEIASINSLKSIKSLYVTVTKHLRNNGVDQWDRFYLNEFVIGKDLKGGHLHAILNDGFCIGVVVLNEDQSFKYAGLPWSDKEGRPAVIHRLAVHPDSQGKGIGKQLLLHAEALATSQGYTSIRLDAYTANPAAITMYERAGYNPVGQIRFPFRKHPYQCFEKIL